MHEATGDFGPQVPRDFCLIIGAMKSGTTSLFEHLAQHPQVCRCREKEPSFFCHPERVAEGRAGYLDLWDWKPSTHRIAVEASTQYTKAPWYSGVPARIASFDGASFRFIYMLRNPLRRIESQVRHSLYEGWGHGLDEGMSKDAVDFSRYAMQLDEFMEHFPRESVLVLLLEEFSEKPDAVLRRVCDFLGISRDFQFANPGEARNSGDFFEIPSVVAAVAKNRWVSHIVGAMPRALKASLRESLAKLGRWRKQGTSADDRLGRWRLTAEESADILESIGGDLDRLRDVYGVDHDRYWHLRGGGGRHPDSGDGAG